MLEGRLETILLRLNFFPSIYFIKRFIASGNVFVNNKLITYPAYFLEYNEIVSIDKRYFKLVYYFLKSKLKSKKVFLNVPSFIEADYKLLVAMLIRSPKISDLTRPVSFNLYTKFLSFNR
jgi:ribosomal protein S4